MTFMAERVGFEPTNTVRCYTLPGRAPSTTRPPLLAAARVPERTQPIKSRHLLAASGLIRGRRLVARRHVVTRFLAARRGRGGALILLARVAVRVQFGKQVAAAHERSRGSQHQNSSKTHAAWSSR